MVDIKDLGEPSPWMPEQNRVRLAALGKLIEELNECASITARCIIQGIDECEPVTGRHNRRELENEIADVSAAAGVVSSLFHLDKDRMLERTLAKVDHLTRWHERIREAEG